MNSYRVQTDKISKKEAAGKEMNKQSLKSRPLGKV